MAKQAETDSNVSRRNFLGGAAAGVAAGALGGWSTASAQPPTGIQEMRTDVVVVGGGMGGLTAAVRAQQQGARVIVLEKAFEPGGTMKHSAGGVAGSEFESMRRRAPDGDPDVQRMVSDGIPLATEFYHSIGAPISGRSGGSARGGSIAPVLFTYFMVTTFERGGGRILVETPMVRLLTNRLHEVIGVLAEGPNGLIRVLAKAVVVATGGWMGNAQMVNQHITRHFGSLRQRNAGWGRHPPFVGDGFFAATALGAAPSTGGFDSFYGHMLPARPGRPTDPMTTYSLYHGPWGIAVNLYGRRFTDETRGRLVKYGAGGAALGGGEMTLNQEVARQPEATAAYIWDEPVNQDRACENCGLGGLDKFPAFRMAGAPVATANTLRELAAQMEGWGVGMQAETVLGQLTEYNQAAENGKASALPIPKAVPENAVPIKQPPFYAVLGTAGITATFGGLRINSQCQVLSRTGRPLRGLYAAGIDIGNYSNYAYLGNLILGAASGYLSGTNAAKQPEPQGGWETGLLS